MEDLFMGANKSNKSNLPQPIRIREAIRMTGLTEKAIYMRVFNRTIPFFKYTGRLYFNPDELQEWLEHQKPRVSVQQALANQKHRKA
jgi:predicted DNA-binding transcriptional regulator AlpA